ncbi:CC157 protein, partial [Eubucco bourcierii]|nr:CC157 protein [Eubucco bourcierii]
MAHLGHRGCMESLRADLRDLQAAVSHVSASAGAVRFRSWKFPNQVSCDLDVGELLERYGHTDNDPEFTQHSHVVLLELVIDRLLLLLQSFTGYAETLLSEGALGPAQAAGPSLSVGLTAKRYCCSMLKLGACYQQLLAEKKTIKERPSPQPTPQAGNPEKKPLKLLSACTPNRDTSGSSLPRAACSTADSSCSAPTPATASSLGACDTCASAQASLREVGKAIISICQSQNIPSALGRFQVAEESAGRRTLSAADMSHWASEQSRDLSRISKHLQRLMQQLSPLKAELEQAEKQRDELRRQAEDFSRLLEAEKQAQEQQRKEAEHSLAAKSREHDKAVARLEQDKAELQKAQPNSCVSLSPEVAKATLLEKMRTTMVAKSQVLELEEKVQLLSNQRESLGQELSSTSLQLEKEKAKVQSILRHEESLQAKLRLLLQHFSSLAQEREELQGSLGEAEEAKAKLEEQLEESRQQSGQQMRAQQTKVSKLEEQTQQLQEQERLLVLFPELHSPAKTPLESSGNVAEDMERQLQANSLRMEVLEQDNTRLRSALAKLKVAAEQGVLKLIPQSQLCCQLSSQPGRECSGQDTGAAGPPAGWCSTAAAGTSVGTAELGRQQAWTPAPLPVPPLP